MSVPKQIYGPGQTAPFQVTSDLTAGYFGLVKLASGVLTAATNKGEAVLGVLIEKVNGATDQKTAQVQIGGIARIKAGGNISEGNYVIASDTDYVAIADDGADQFVVGAALEGAVSGDYFACRLILAPTLTA
jgi:hypothetical protein